jgi:hypothetical protein
LLKKGISLRNVQKISGTSINTLRKLKEMLWKWAFYLCSF